MLQGLFDSETANKVSLKDRITLIPPTNQPHDVTFCTDRRWRYTCSQNLNFKHSFLKSSFIDSVTAMPVFESMAPWCKLAFICVAFHVLIKYHNKLWDFWWCSPLIDIQVIKLGFALTLETVSVWKQSRAPQRHDPDQGHYTSYNSKCYISFLLWYNECEEYFR